MEEILNIRFKTKTKEGKDTANYQHAMRFVDLLRRQANGVSNKKEFTNEYLDNFFRSNATRNAVIKVLKEEGIIEVTKSYITNVKGKEYRLHNDYLPDDLKSKYCIDPFNLDSDIKSNPNGSVEEDMFFKAKPGPEGFVQMFGDSADQDTKTITVSYKGFGAPEEVTFTKEDKDIVKEVRSSLEFETEDSFVSACMQRGFSKTKAWYFYFKILKQK